MTNQSPSLMHLWSYCKSLFLRLTPMLPASFQSDFTSSDSKLKSIKTWIAFRPYSTSGCSKELLGSLSHRLDVLKIYGNSQAVSNHAWDQVFMVLKPHVNSSTKHSKLFVHIFYRELIFYCGLQTPKSLKPSIY